MPERPVVTEVMVELIAYAKLILDKVSEVISTHIPKESVSGYINGTILAKNRYAIISCLAVRGCMRSASG